MSKYSFTLIELVFVIVVIGIISAMIIPRLDRDNRYEAATQLLNHIKYTQHLAMTQDIYNNQNANWFRARWEIQLYACGGYVVHSDINLLAGAPARSNAALDPQTGKSLFVSNTCSMPMPATDFEKINLAGYYDVSGITTTGCGGLSISFDNLGRPYRANTINGVIQANCQIALNFNNGASEIIRVHPETGYACILNMAATNCI